MKEFFIDKEQGIPFQMFDLTHICITLLLLLGLFIIYKNRNKFKNIKDKRKLRIIFASIILLNMLILYGSYLIYGVYDWHSDLPFHLCFITGIGFSIAMLFDLKKLYKIMFFWVFVGPIPAVIWPSNTSCFDNYVFYHYIISHHGLLLFNMIIYYMDEVKIEQTDMLKSFIYCNFVFVFMIIFNSICHTNYIMSRNLPTRILETYPFLEYFNHPIIILEIVGIIVMLLTYKYTKIRNKELKKS